jgi:RNA polymerase sigma factor for flagellar operon FliA
MPALPLRNRRSVAASNVSGNGHNLPYSLAEALAHVRLIARQVRKHLPAHVDLDDLVSEGVLGLLEAAQKFDPTRGIQFRTYAEPRIRGAIQDSLRRIDPLPRTMRGRQRDGERAVANLTATLGRPPQDAEIARQLNMPLAQWQQLARELHDAGCPVNGHGWGDRRLVPVETLRSHERDPEQEAADEEMGNFLRQALAALTSREREILALRYQEEWTMREIGERFGVSESRASQMHAAAIRLMRVHLSRTDAKIEEIG